MSDVKPTLHLFDLLLLGRIAVLRM